MSDVVVGRAIVFKVEDTVGVVKGQGKIRVIHYLIFKGPRRGAGRKPRWLVHTDTDWEKVPGCELSGVLDALLKCILEWKAMFGVSA